MVRGVFITDTHERKRKVRLWTLNLKKVFLPTPAIKPLVARRLSYSADDKFLNQITGIFPDVPTLTINFIRIPFPIAILLIAIVHIKKRVPPTELLCDGIILK